MASFVFFTAASQTFALPAESVEQVLRMAAPTAVPGAPPYLRGLLNLRGALVPVVDVRVRLGDPARPARPGDHLLVAAEGGRRVALVVDRVLGVRELPDDAVQPGPAWPAATPRVASAVTVEDGVVLVQALSVWLADAESATAGQAP
jgi:purine-binding chemotaxis protein CheW